MPPGVTLWFEDAGAAKVLLDDYAAVIAAGKDYKICKHKMILQPRPLDPKALKRPKEKDPEAAEKHSW